mgnify:FL=1
MSPLPSLPSEALVQEARSWVGTPYHHMGDIRGVGVDCGMLLVRIFCDLGICAPFDPRPYTRDWHLHQSEERYLSYVYDNAAEISREELAPGDIILFQFGRCFSHGAIVTSVAPLTVVHAVHDYGMVVEEVADTSPEVMRRMQKSKFFRVGSR